MTLTKMQGVLGLFILLVAILITSPGFYNNMYNNVLGRVFLIILLIFFATNNVTLGLLVALIIIIATNIQFIEGMTNSTMTNKNEIDNAAIKTAKMNLNDATNNISSTTQAKTIGVDDAEMSNPSVADGTKIIVTTNKKVGVNKPELEETMKSKSSNQIPVSSANFKSSDVSAFDMHASQEGFVSQYGSF